MSGVARAEAQGEGVLRVSGSLDFESVPGLWQDSEALFAAEPPAVIDLDGVTRVDSAGLALLVGWARSARAGGREVSFVHVPEQMLHMARVSGLDAVLDLAV